MRTAVLISGQLRGFKYIINNLRNNLLNNLGETDIFFYIPYDSYKVEYMFTPTDIRYKHDTEHDVSSFTNFTGPDKQRYIQQWYSLYKCKELMLSHNKQYDYIVRTRPDNDFVTPLTLDLLNLDQINVCSWGSYGGYNDRFAIGPFNQMLVYCDFYLSCTQYSTNSESRLKQYLDNNDIKVNLIDHVHYRINEDGSKREHP
jgi:hypothetical protein